MNDEHTSNPSPAPASPPSVDPRSVEGIFLAALEQERGQRRVEFVGRACGNDPQLQLRVEALLRAYDDAGSFLQQPVGNWQSPPLSEPAMTASPSLDRNGIPQGLLQPSDSPEFLGKIGPYRVQKVLGRGGMGVVMRALDPKLNRVVAIKVLAPELNAHPAARRRFLREARAAAAVAHPHVIAIYEVNTVEETDWPYLVMEYIEGPSLQGKIDRAGPLDLPEVLRIGTQIAEGLAAAHKQGLVHLDIKPANILLENGVERVKITDFGLARGADDATITNPGEISGTPQYMSPEQASGERVDQRSDLFSLGCVLYTMCAGHSPFRAKGLAATVKRICEDDPRPLREFDAQFPEWLAGVIDRLLAKEPAQRIQTAEEVARILGAALAQVQAGRAVDAPVARLAARTVARRPQLSAWLGVVASGLAGFGYGRLIPDGRNEGIWFAGSLPIAAAMLFFCVRRLRTTSSTWGALFVLVGLMAFVTAMGAGHEQLNRHVLEFGLVDGLALLIAALVGFLSWRELRGRDMGEDNPNARCEPATQRPASLLSQPWKIVGWLVVGMLVSFLVLPILVIIGVLIPSYQAKQSRRDMQTFQATAAHLTLSFDEDLRITDILIDGTPAGQVEISPVERMVAPGARTITVVYKYQDHKRSVRETIEVKPHEQSAIDLTQLVQADITARAKTADAATPNEN